MGAERKPPSTTTQTRHMTSQVHAWDTKKTSLYGIWPASADEAVGWLCPRPRPRGSLRHGLLLREEPPERPADRALAFGMGARHGQVGEGVRVEQEDQLADHARQCVA